MTVQNLTRQLLLDALDTVEIMRDDENADELIAEVVESVSELAEDLDDDGVVYFDERDHSALLLVLDIGGHKTMPLSVREMYGMVYSTDDRSDQDFIDDEMLV